MVRRSAIDSVQSGGGGATQDEIYQIFEGSNPEGQALSLFEDMSGDKNPISNLILGGSANLLIYNAPILNLSVTPQKVCSGVNLRGYTLVNPNVVTVWFKFRTVLKGGAAPANNSQTVDKIAVPPGSTVVWDNQQSRAVIGVALDTYVSVTTNYLNTDTTAPAINCEFFSRVEDYAALQ